MSGFFPYIYPDSDYSVDGSSDEGSKYQDKPDYREQELVSSLCRNPMRIRQSNQIALGHLKIKIVSSKDELFFIKNTSAGSIQAKW